MRPVLVYAGTTVVAFGLMPFFKKLALEAGVSPWMVALGTVLFAALATVAVGWRHSHGILGEVLASPSRGYLLLIGILATGLVTLLVVQALSTTSATNRSLFQAAYPAATLLFAHLMLGERLRPLQYLSIGAMILGLLLVNGLDGGVRFGQGFWLLVLTLPLIGFSDVYGKRLTERFSPLIIAYGRNLYGAAFVVAAVPLLDLGDWPGLAPGVWIALGGLSQGIGIWTLYRALGCSKASLVASLIATAPLVTVAAEITLLGLQLSVLQWVGVVLVISMAIYLAQQDGR